MADITFISASIGGGKSLFATRAACEEMARSNRFVVTNLPIYTEAAEGILTFQEWCQKYVEKPVDTLKRFRLLTREEVFEFWRYLPGGVKLPEMQRSRPDGSTETVTNLDIRNAESGQWYSGIGCFYIIDEVHLFFSARDWTKIGNRVEFYMSQLRKLNDDLFLISQHPEKVDKNFRRNATEWIYLQNMGKARLWLGVSLPRRFRFHTYFQMPVRNDKPVNSGWMKLEDREYHKVYNTMSGVGLSGKLLPEDSRKKGRHWSVYVLALVGVGLLAWYFPRLFTEFTGKAIGGAVRSFSGGISKGMGLAPTNAVHPIAQLPVNVPTERIRSAPLPQPSRPAPGALARGLVHGIIHPAAKATEN
ncbi:MAG TPA: zonular occludens toxin domain-containing protein [Verrucomicrobiae bacterium]|jgi:hypothetical protein|nr:zonular occludens toxin domain-containing protein [Verrucomicrobiae bacterium]